MTVGEYVGQVAASAAQAVRRAGLRPGLDRSFGCSPELFGQVVAQDPPAGSELARNGLVTLYVAAPSVVQAEENDTGGVKEQPRVPEPADVPSEQDTLEWDPVSVADPAQVEDAEAYGELGEEWAENEPAHAEPGETWAEYEPAHEEFTAHVDHRLAGPVTGERNGWRRPARGARARLAEHPWLVGVTGGMLVVWAVVGVTTMLTGHRVSADRKRVAPAVAQRATAPRPHAGAPPDSSATQMRSVAARTIPAGAHHQSRVGRVYTHGPRRAARRAPVMRIVASRATTSASAPVAASQAEATAHASPVTPEEAASAPAPAVTPSQAAAQERSSAEERVAIEFGPER